MIFNVNIICKQYGIPKCAHSLEVPGLCFVFGLRTFQRAETCSRIFNIDYQYMLRY